jgi:hypothetical protein
MHCGPLVRRTFGLRLGQAPVRAPLDGDGAIEAISTAVKLQVSIDR